jgi:hypothetical protein
MQGEIDRPKHEASDLLLRRRNTLELKALEYPVVKIQAGLSPI